MIVNGKKLPDFLIVGAQKSATTSLFHILRQHPAIFSPSMKEPAFFSYRGDKEKAVAFNKAFRFTEKNIPPMTELDAYLKLFEKAGDHQLAGEASTHYLYDYDVTIKNIKEIYGESYHKLKIIIVLRNPIRRAFSAWSMLTRNGMEDLDFLEAVKQSHERKIEKKVNDYDYLGFSLYYRQVKAYTDNFEHVRIFLHEDFEKDIDKLTAETLSFLELEPKDLNTKFKLNTSGIMKNKAMARFLYTDNGLKSFIKKLIPGNLALNLRTKVEKKLITNIKLEKNHELYLKQVFNEDVSLLSSLTGKREVLKWIE